MVIGLLAIAAIPTVIGVGQAVGAQKRASAANKEKDKFHLTAMLEIEGEKHETGFCVLRNGRLVFALPGGAHVEGHSFCGYHFTYPSEEKHLGLVSTISEDPPMLNWIFVDKDTHVVGYGARKDTMGHIIGPWGWSDDESFLTLQGDHEAFVAKREDDDDGEGGWAVLWDPGHEIRAAERPENCKIVRLRRRLLLGMESRFVKD